MAKKITAELKEMEAFTVHGVWARSSYYSADTEWENLMRLYTAVTQDKGTRYVIRENVDAKMDCDLFCGGNTANEQTSDVTVPEGLYVCARVKPKFGLFWGGALDETDLYLFKTWPEESGYELDDFRMEIRDMTGKDPYVDILYKIKEPETKNE